MSKLSLLLIPLLFMTSCTIDWNDEKDAKIAELEKQVTKMSLLEIHFEIFGLIEVKNSLHRNYSFKVLPGKTNTLV